MSDPKQRCGEEILPADPLAVSASVASAFDVLDPETLDLEESPRHPSPEEE